MSSTTTTITQPKTITLRGAKNYQPIPSLYQSSATKSKLQASFGRNWIKDQFSLSTWLSIGASLQLILFLILKPYLASLPVLGYTLYTITSLIHASLTTKTPPTNPEVHYHKTTSLVPTSSGTIQSGTSGSKVAVLHLGFKNYSPLGPLAPGFKKIFTFAPEMIAELDSPAGREKYGYLGSDSFFQSSSPVSSTNASTLMVVMYFRSLEDVHAYARSELHRKAWDWYANFSEKQGNKHLGIMHEVFEADAGKWESVGVNIEPVGLAKATVRMDDGSEVGTIVDARRGVLASAKGRIA